jgi:hypothetical protein
VGVLTLGLYSPILIVKGRTTPSVLSTSTSSWTTFWSSLLTQTTVFRQEFQREMPFPISLILGTGLVVALCRDANLRRLIVALIVPLVLLSVAMRMVPFVRVWLYLLPVAYLAIAFGLVSLLRSIGNDRVRLVCLTLILAGGGLGLGLRAATLEPREFSKETGTLYDAEAIIAFLKANLSPEDYVISVFPSTSPLVYQARRQSMPLRHFESIGDSHSLNRRLIVVVNQAHGQTLKGVLGYLELEDEFPVESALEIQSTESADVYRLLPVFRSPSPSANQTAIDNLGPKRKIP